MTKRKYKEERKKILEKYGKPMSEFPDEELKDEKSGSWIWLMDSVDYKRQNRIGCDLIQKEVEYRNLINKTVGR